jgi:hypothetical protein
VPAGGAGSLRLLVSLVWIAGTVHDDRCSLVKDSTAGSRHPGPGLPSTGELSYSRWMGISVGIPMSDPLAVFRRAFSQYWVALGSNRRHAKICWHGSVRSNTRSSY